MDEQASVSPREAAQMMGMRLDAVYSLIWANRLPADKHDGRWFVLRSAVEARLKGKTECESKTRSCDRSIP